MKEGRNLEECALSSQPRFRFHMFILFFSLSVCKMRVSSISHILMRPELLENHVSCLIATP